MHRMWKKTRHEELERARKVALLLLLLPGMQDKSSLGLDSQDLKAKIYILKLWFPTYSFKEVLQISHIYLFLPTQSLSKPFYLSYKGLSKVYTNQLFEWVIIFVILCTITHFDSYPTSQGPVSSAQWYPREWQQKDASNFHKLKSKLWWISKLSLVSLTWFRRFSLWRESTTRLIFRIAAVALSSVRIDLICDNRRRLWTWRQSPSTGDARRQYWPQRGSWQREPERWVEDAEHNENGGSGNGWKGSPGS